MNMTAPLPTTEMPGADIHAAARILIVDDSAMLRTIIASHLRQAGSRNLVFAKDGEEALRSCEDETPDLVITDLAMPNMNGFDLCTRLRANPRTADVPILIQTGSEFKEDRARSFAAGASDLITKPIEGAELTARVRVHLDRRALIKSLTEYRRKMAEELELARSMQESLLPGRGDRDQLEKRFPLQLASTYEPSLDLGGDVWGIIPLSDTRLRIFTADFTGHGVGSALNTFRLHSFITSGAADAEDPALWLQQLNEFLCGALQVGQFATMFSAVIDFAANDMRYACAATPPPLLRSAQGARFQQIDGTGFPIGVTRLARFETCRTAFPPGATLVLYSDALIETPDPRAALFTPESLGRFLDTSHPGCDAQVAHDAILSRLKQEAPAPLSDDLTLITLCHRQEGRRS